MDKTITVSVERKVKHPLYGKFVKKSTKTSMRMMKKNECSIGDTVKIMESRPLGKTKRWNWLRLLKKVK
ncbi:MAG: 30S ribosomal protein S17 [Chitinophagaceae bacterium]|nr:30S ribosomal protein S17 [Chitinophagaceae bacterium]